MKHTSYKPNDISITAVILAGGKSSRMGQPKLWLKDKYGNSFVNKIASSVSSAGIDNVIAVINKKFNTNQWKNELNILEKTAIIKVNNKPENGRLYSIFLGIKDAHTTHILLLNVDNPYVNHKIFGLLIANSNYGDVIIPRFNNKGGHPILFNNKIKNEILTNYSSYTTLKEVLNKFNKHYVDVDDKRVLININTLDDLKKTKYDFV